MPARAGPHGPRPDGPTARKGLPFAEPAELIGREVPKLAGLEAAASHRPQRDAPELRDRMAHSLEQPPHLVVLAFVQGDLDPRVLAGLENARAIHGHALALHPDAALEPLEGVRVGNAANL